MSSCPTGITPLFPPHIEIEYPALHCPNRTIVVSKTLRRYFEEKYLIRPDYIPNGVNDPIREPVEGLQKWQLNPGEYFLFLGRLTPEKGAHLLVDAFARMETSRKLVVAGGSAFTDEYVEDLQQRADSKTIFTGYVHGSDLSTLLTHAYAVVLPSTMEGLSIALLEALSYSRCVLISDIPENLEVVDDAAPTFRSKDTDDLQRALQELDQDPGKVKHYEELVGDRLARRFTWDVVVSELMELYDQVVRGQRAEPMIPPL